MSEGISIKESILLADIYLYKKDYVFYGRLDRAIACLIGKGFVNSEYNDDRFKDYHDYLMVRGYKRAVDTLCDKGLIKQVDHFKLPQNPTIIIPNSPNPELDNAYFQYSKKLGEELQEFNELIDSLYNRGIIDSRKETIKYILNWGNISEKERKVLRVRLNTKSSGWGRREEGKRIVPPKKGLEYADMFICSASFEDRCTKVTDEISASARPEYSFLFVDTATYNLKVGVNLREMEKKLKKISKEIAIIKCDFNKVEQAVSIFKKACLELGLQLKNKVIFVDDSTFTKALLLGLLPVVDNGRNYVRNYYTEVGDYGIRQSYGDYKIQPINQFRGNFFSNKKDLLVIFVGFEGDRTKSAIEQIDPDSTILLIGGDAKRDWVRRALKTNKSIKGKEIELQYTTSLDNEKVYEYLVQVYNKYHDNYNITILPIGSKIQVLGIYEFQKEFPDVKILTAPPEDHSNYDLNYSIESGNIHKIPMNTICKNRKDEIIVGYV